MVIASILLIPTYVIEPFLGFNSTVETCESKEQVIQKTTRDNKTYVEYFFNIELAREKKESDKPLLVPQGVGERINKGDKMDKLGIDEVKEVLGLAFSVGQLVESLSDGVGLNDIGKLVSVVKKAPSAVTAIKSGKVIPELKDLDDNEKSELKKWAASEFDLSDDKIESLEK
jgi:hypothetical protein